MVLQKRDCDICTHRYVCKFRDDYSVVDIETSKIDELINPIIDKLGLGQFLLLECIDFDKEDE